MTPPRPAPNSKNRKSMSRKRANRYYRTDHLVRLFSPRTRSNNEENFQTTTLTSTLTSACASVTGNGWSAASACPLDFTKLSQSNEPTTNDQLSQIFRSAVTRL